LRAVFGAGVIVTYNLKDFPSEYLASFGIEAQHPDEFISNLMDMAPGQVCLAVRQVRARLRNPPLDIDDYLIILARQHLAVTVTALRQYRDLI